MDVFDAISERQTVWSYQQRQVEPEKIERILEAARWAPSGANSQPWDFVVVTDTATKSQLKGLLKEGHSRWMTQAMPEPRPQSAIDVIHQWVEGYSHGCTEFIVCCVNYRTGADPARQAKLEYIYHMNHQSIGAAMENLMLAATALGLGTHWVGAASLVQAELQQLLGIPASVEVIAVLTLGYPAADAGAPQGSPRGKRDRLPLDVVAHYNRW